jgi:murein DD-endopeptidase MepM/ murein hydrolase activator NlpD
VHQQVAELKVQAEAALTQATAARKTAVAAKDRLDLLFAAQTRYAATVAAKKATEITKIERMQAQSDSLTRVLAARARAARGDAADGGQQPGSRSGQQGGNGFLSLPARSPVSSEFGLRLHPVLRIVRLHAGIDFAAACGSPVYAAAAGEVIMTTPATGMGGYGNQLVIDHGLQGGVDLTTTYGHLTSFVVTGGRVSRGQLVAYAGTTGLSTGCHLHFETREDGTPVNPRRWF